MEDGLINYFSSILIFAKIRAPPPLSLFDIRTYIVLLLNRALKSGRVSSTEEKIEAKYSWMDSIISSIEENLLLFGEEIELKSISESNSILSSPKKYINLLISLSKLF